MPDTQARMPDTNCTITETFDVSFEINPSLEICGSHICGSLVSLCPGQSRCTLPYISVQYSRWNSHTQQPFEVLLSRHIACISSSREIAQLS